MKNYKLGELLGDGLANTRTYTYEFLGADQTFVRELLQYGYHHKGCVERHDDFLHSHITLVFRRCMMFPNSEHTVDVRNLCDNVYPDIPAECISNLAIRYCLSYII